MPSHTAHTTPKAAAAPGKRRAVMLKRVRADAAPRDGTRVLVDRLWPRGIAKEHVQMDLWLREIAPSTDLRRWYAHDPSRWTAFAAKYRQELAQHIELLQQLDQLRRRGRLTLLYDAHDSEHNQATVLREVLIERTFARQDPKRNES